MPYTFKKVGEDWNILTENQKEKLLKQTTEDFPTKDELLSIGEPFQIAIFTEKDITQKLYIEGIPVAQIIIPTNWLNTSNLFNIKSAKIETYRRNQGDVRVCVTNDKETYYVYKDNTWKTIDINTLYTDGNTPEEIEAMTADDWSMFNNTNFAFAYSLNIETPEDKAMLLSVSLFFDIYSDATGELWRAQVHGIDYDYEYVNKETLRVYLYKSGNYKINYANDHGQTTADDLNSAIYGVRFDGVNSQGVRTDDAVGMVFEPSTNTVKGRDDFETVRPFNVRECLTYYDSETRKRELYAYKEDSEEYRTARASGKYDVMIEFPMFYYQRPSKWEWKISAVQHEGFLPSPMHARPDRTYKYIRISKYKTNKLYLTSIPNNNLYVYDTTLNPFTMRTFYREKGLYILDYMAISSIRMLAAVKYSNLDTQKTIGLGKNYSTGNFYTGTTDNILGIDGSPTSKTIYEAVSCFGIENLWGATPTIIEGLVNVYYTNYIISDISQITLDKNVDVNLVTNTWTNIGSVSRPPTVINQLSTVQGYRFPMLDISYNTSYPYAIYPTSVGSNIGVSSDIVPSGPFSDCYTSANLNGSMMSLDCRFHSMGLFSMIDMASSNAVGITNVHGYLSMELVP